MKKCISCKQTLSADSFPPNKKNKDGLNTKCRGCFNAYMKEWYAKNKDKHKARVAEARPKVRAAKYGLTPVEVDAMLEKFDGLCWCCKKNPAIAVDHCHTTGKVRGMLCMPCNTGIGKLGDDVEGLLKAVEYLNMG